MIQGNLETSLHQRELFITKFKVTTQYKSWLSSSFDVFTTGNYLLCQLLQVVKSVKTEVTILSSVGLISRLSDRVTRVAWVVAVSLLSLHL